MLLKNYETIVIFNPDGEDIPKAEIKKFEEIISKFHDVTRRTISVEDMGVKKLAYRIKDKYDYGRYAVYKWWGTPDDVVELERQLRIDDHVIKFISVKSDADPEEDVDEDAKSEQVTTKEDAVATNPNKNIDAYDVLLGRAHYTHKKNNVKNLTNN